MTPAPHRPWRRIVLGIFITSLAVLLFAYAARYLLDLGPEKVPEEGLGAPEAQVESPFTYAFSEAGILHESDSPSTSSSPYWWLDSGGKLIVEDGVGKTLHGDLPESDPWHRRYARSTNGDTDDGAHPQNIFRLLTRSKWDNVRADMSFRVTGDNFSDSSNRNESNGLLIMSRYKDGDNLYYAGVRVDGHAVIKKKYNGTYYTMAEAPIFEGEYENGDDKSLIPHNEWLTLRMETTSSADAVAIRLLMLREGETEWTVLLTAEDSGKYAQTPPITGEHPLGIRTDFMDVEFDNFRAEKI